MSVRLFVPLALIVCAGGLAVGWFGHARWQARSLPPPVRRSPEVRALLKAYESGAWKDIAREDARRLGDEALLLRAVATRDWEELTQLSAPDRAPAIRARAELAFRRVAFPGLDTWIGLFRERYPDSWMLRTAEARDGRVPR